MPDNRLQILYKKPKGKVYKRNDNFYLLPTDNKKECLVFASEDLAFMALISL